MLIIETFTSYKKFNDKIKAILEEEDDEEEAEETTDDTETETETDTETEEPTDDDLGSNDDAGMDMGGGMDTGMGGGMGMDAGMGMDGGMGGGEVDAMGNPIEPKYNGQTKFDIFRSYTQLVKALSKSCLMKIDGPFDLTMGIDYNSTYHNKCVWYFTPKEKDKKRFMLVAQLNPEKLADKYSDDEEEEDKPKEDDNVDANSDPMAGMDAGGGMGMGGSTEPKKEKTGPFYINVYDLEKDKSYKKEKANLNHLTKLFAKIK